MVAVGFCEYARFESITQCELGRVPVQECNCSVQDEDAANRRSCIKRLCGLAIALDNRGVRSF